MRRDFEKVGDVFARDGKRWKVTKIYYKGGIQYADCIPVDSK